jgi:hypothetical protein
MNVPSFYLPFAPPYKGGEREYPTEASWASRGRLRNRPGLTDVFCRLTL